jgi:hypothetical protein
LSPGKAGRPVAPPAELSPGKGGSPVAPPVELSPGKGGKEFCAAGVGSGVAAVSSFFFFTEVVTAAPFLKRFMSGEIEPISGSRFLTSRVTFLPIKFELGSTVSSMNSNEEV